LDDIGDLFVTMPTLSHTLVSDRHQLKLEPLTPPVRRLLGPGPSNAHPAVLDMVGRPPIGHMDPVYLHAMSELQEFLRYVWQTDNRLTLTVSGTGTAAMEATLVNVIEPGDTVLVAVAGYFSERLVDMASRLGAKVVRIDCSWGEAFSFEAIEQAFETHRPDIFAMVHAETSTGVCQPMDGIGELCHRYNCLSILDTVTSLGCIPVFLDEWGIDISYSCSQKGLSCLPGIAPVTFSPRAEEKIARRKTPVPNWYLDVKLLEQYWTGDHDYHHTAPVNMNLGLHEGLRLLANEGLEQSWERHRHNAERFWTGLEALGLRLLVPPDLRLTTLTTICIPEDIDGSAWKKHLLNNYGVQVGGGLGVLDGSVWRIGLMGYNSTMENVDLLLSLFESELPKVRGTRG
jgi:alanine-glyoxylate transaminase/serine-glyoxylate transaminase/serine-pyruvate transaminase